MTVAKRYRVPAGTHRVEQEISRSRFITTASRVSTVEEATAFIRGVAGEFTDATHNCWAYAVGPPGDTARVGMSDDGEPHGTAGRPMLSALLHSGVGDVAVVVTRYYGGTKLGTGGLVRAYSGGVQFVLAGLPLVDRIDYVALRVVIDYARIAALQQLLPAFEAEITRQVFAADVRVDIRLPSSRVSPFRQAVLDATRGLAAISSIP